MELQNYIVQKIDKHGGPAIVAGLFNEIEFPDNKVFHLNEMKLLFSMIYKMDIDLQEIAIDNENRIISALLEFDKDQQRNPTEFKKDIIKIIHKHLNSIPGRYSLKVV